MHITFIICLSGSQIGQQETYFAKKEYDVVLKQGGIIHIVLQTAILPSLCLQPVRIVRCFACTGLMAILSSCLHKFRLNLINMQQIVKIHVGL